MGFRRTSAARVRSFFISASLPSRLSGDALSSFAAAAFSSAAFSAFSAALAALAALASSAAFFAAAASGHERSLNSVVD